MNNDFEEAYEYAPEDAKTDKSIAEYWFLKGRLSGRDQELREQFGSKPLVSLRDVESERREGLRIDGAV